MTHWVCPVDVHDRPVDVGGEHVSLLLQGLALLAGPHLLLQVAHLTHHPLPRLLQHCHQLLLQLLEVLLALQ